MNDVGIFIENYRWYHALSPIFKEIAIALSWIKLCPLLLHHITIFKLKHNNALKTLLVEEKGSYLKIQVFAGLDHSVFPVLGVPQNTVRTKCNFLIQSIYNNQNEPIYAQQQIILAVQKYSRPTITIAKTSGDGKNHDVEMLQQILCRNLT